MDWTQEERLKVIEEIAERGMQKMKRGFVTRQECADAIQVIQYLVSMPGEFLEMNKQNITGQWKPFRLE